MKRFFRIVTQSIAKAPQWALVGALCFLSAGIGAGIEQYINPPTPRPQIIRLGKASLINPLLDTDTLDQNQYTEFNLIKQKVADLIKKEIHAQRVTAVSVYFRGMNYNRWFGINENEKFAPASLLKVPVMIAVFRAAESDPHILTTRLIFQGPDTNTEETFRPAERMSIGREYTVNDLVHRMIVYSDNNALFLILAHLNDEVLNRTFTDLGVPIPNPQDNVNDIMSVRTYSSFFRILYNATYLSRTLSDKALEYLSQTDFSIGLFAGVPPSVTLAHKFGECSVTSVLNSGEISRRELHDCGIVYHPKHPYFLCVATRGNNYTQLAEAIAHISIMIYQWADTNYPSPPIP